MKTYGGWYLRHGRGAKYCGILHPCESRCWDPRAAIRIRVEADNADEAWKLVEARVHQLFPGDPRPVAGRSYLRRIQEE